VIVTKDSGRRGGVEAKLAAARKTNCRVIVIRRPETPTCGPIFDHPATLITALKDIVYKKRRHRMIYLTNIDSVEPDQKMNREKGFAAMELRWLLSEANAPVTLCTIGHTRKQKGGERVELKKGDCLFIPRGVVHSHKVTEDPVETYCIYIGAGSIEKTGYVLDEK
jgi:hypothetical protein